MTPEPEAEIARGLSPEQREDILLADAGDPFCPHFSRLYNADNTCPLVDAYAAHQDPDHEAWEDGGTRWSFSDLGKAVRAHLAQSKEGLHGE